MAKWVCPFAKSCSFSVYASWHCMHIQTGCSLCHNGKIPVWYFWQNSQILQTPPVRFIQHKCKSQLAIWKSTTKAGNGLPLKYFRLVNLNSELIIGWSIIWSGINPTYRKDVQSLVPNLSTYKYPPTPTILGEVSCQTCSICCVQGWHFTDRRASARKKISVLVPSHLGNQNIPLQC